MRTVEIERVEKLLRIAEIPAETPLCPALQEIAALVSEALGIDVLSVILYRRAWDDFKTVVVHSSDPADQARVGRCEPREQWSRRLPSELQQRPTAYVAAPFPCGSMADPGHDCEPDDHRALLAMMRAADGELVGFLSAEQSAPTPPVARAAEAKLLSVAARMAATEIRDRRQAARQRSQTRAFKELLRLSATLSAGRVTDDILHSVCEGIAGALEFDKVAAFLVEEDGWLRPHASFGWHEVGGVPLREVHPAALAPLLAPEHMVEGSSLLDGPTAAAVAPREVPRTYTSRRNGRGPLGWHNHWLLVPLRDSAGALAGVIWVDDPTDHSVPAVERLQALRLFADQAATAIEAARRTERWREMAERDALTGLPNRRALRAFLAAESADGFAYLSCDLDRFKQLNDSLGHEAGDDALVRFGRLLEHTARPSDLPVRVGGEEFALVLPLTGAGDALSVAERLLSATREHFRDIGNGLTVSIGVAAASPADAETTRQVLSDADRALYAAKRAGRDRAVLHDDGAVQPTPSHKGNLHKP